MLAKTFAGIVLGLPLALALVALAVCLVAPTLMKADSSAFVGTWKINLEKSKYPAGAAPKSLTRTITADGDKGISGNRIRIDLKSDL